VFLTHGPLSCNWAKEIAQRIAVLRSATRASETPEVTRGAVSSSYALCLGKTAEI